MYKASRIALKYFKYLLTASNGKGHGIHSPFVYRLVKEVLQQKEPTDLYKKIEAERNQLLLDKSSVPMADFGAGSRFGNPEKKRVTDIARHSLKSPKYARLMHRLCDFVEAKECLELGTSLGITTAYLASANKVQQVDTLEGSPAISEMAKKLFEKLGLQQKISLHTGDFATTLSPLLEQLPALDFAFLDGNHRYEPTVEYCLQILPKMNANGVMILDDIHWSDEMEKAWEWVKTQETVTITVDLFFIGLVFFRTDNKVKQHFVIRY